MTIDTRDTPGTSMRTAMHLYAQRGQLLAADCPSRSVLSHITSRWGVLVLVVLLQGTRRFSELRREVGGVSEKMLAQTLDALTGDGFILRQAYLEIPPKVEYSLTPLGIEAAQRLALLVDWIEDNYPRIEAAREALGTAA
ncbi:winged helix-turn-helix transcriptional regulator [Janthinobacterium agaricidamnosum]|uniref:Putative transcriptional regulator n=1 Tax=Janthinobacterium agaricidamnosum NBRC 102515 = DSM 9628 TaxID=1349767 RepID=W0V800_9BURK|nr:putative transcriptional regulator [Janthinobacterium agaricidamnosum NBRC 102515 = DSM 9628]